MIIDEECDISLGGNCADQANTKIVEVDEDTNIKPEVEDGNDNAENPTNTDTSEEGEGNKDQSSEESDSEFNSIVDSEKQLEVVTII